jgi:NAD(P)-dependent dehydrogenase (short-subunit alcohol dehydrogenase family)
VTMTSPPLASKVLVIGSRSVVAQAVSALLIEKKYDVLLADKPLPGSHIDPLFEVDVTDMESCRRLAAIVPPDNLTGVVCCAGLGIPGAIIDGSDWDWSEVIRVNLFGARNVLSAFSPLLNRQPRLGAFVFISSINSTLPVKGYSAYCASKAGLEMLVKVAALELAPTIRVNAVAPGPLYTNKPLHLHFPGFLAGLESRHPIGGRLTHANEVAETVLFLLSENALRISGQSIVVDGAVSLNYGDLPDSGPDTSQYM